MMGQSQTSHVVLTAKLVGTAHSYAEREKRERIVAVEGVMSQAWPRSWNLMLLSMGGTSARPRRQTTQRGPLPL